MDQTQSSVSTASTKGDVLVSRTRTCVSIYGTVLYQNNQKSSHIQSSGKTHAAGFEVPHFGDETFGPVWPVPTLERLKTLKQMRRRFSADYDTFFDRGAKRNLKAASWC